MLVVDDNPSIREWLVTLVEEELAASAVQAEDSKQALLLLGEMRPAVILTDICMPELDGTELVRRLRAFPATEDIPIVVMTASISCRDEAIAAGGEEYLEKPFNRDRLLQKVGRYLMP